MEGKTAIIWTGSGNLFILIFWKKNANYVNRIFHCQNNTQNVENLLLRPRSSSAQVKEKIFKKSCWYFISIWVCKGLVWYMLFLAGYSNQPLGMLCHYNLFWNCHFFGLKVCSSTYTSPTPLYFFVPIFFQEPYYVV